MSLRAIRESSHIHMPEGDIVLELKITNNGQMQLTAPHLHPKDVCKLLQNVIVDVTFSVLQMKEQSSIVQPVNPIA